MKKTPLGRMHLLALALITLSSGAWAQTNAAADLRDAAGARVGLVELSETPHGVLLDVRLGGLPAGAHAFHIHSVGACIPPFTSAGGHFNPYGKKHGLLNPEGKHAGDLPNVHVPASGSLRVEMLADEVTLVPGKPNSLFDSDGSAIVIHQGPDDYRTDPAGAAGPRIACGVVVPR